MRDADGDDRHTRKDANTELVASNGCYLWSSPIATAAGTVSPAVEDCVGWARKPRYDDMHSFKNSFSFARAFIRLHTTTMIYVHFPVLTIPSNNNQQPRLYYQATPEIFSRIACPGNPVAAPVRTVRSSRAPALLRTGPPKQVRASSPVGCPGRLLVVVISWTVTRCRHQ